MIGAFLGLAVVWLVVELLVWYGIAQFMSGWWVFLWFICAFFIGSALLRTGMKNISPMTQQMQTGMFNPASRPPQSIMIKSVAFVIAGFLLIIPGVLSDLMALIVMLPPVQNKLHDYANNYAMKNQEKMMAMMQQRMQDMGMNGSQFQQQGSANPFGKSNPFQSNPFGSNSGFGNFGGGFGKTIDGEATVVKDVNQKKITKVDAANDDK